MVYEEITSDLGITDSFELILRIIIIHGKPLANELKFTYVTNGGNKSRNYIYRLL